MENQAEVSARAIRKIVAAIEGLGHKPAAFGALAEQAWGASAEPKVLELLVATGEDRRESLLSAARGEGLQQTPEAGPLRLRYADAKLEASAAVGLVEASTPFLKAMLKRAQPGSVLRQSLLLTPCEDLIILRAGSTLPGDRSVVIELLRANAGRIDAPYLKREAEAAGVFDSLKIAWQEAKRQG